MKSHEVKPQSAPFSVLPSRLKRFFSFLCGNLCLPLIIIVLLAAIGWFGYASVEREMKDNLSAQLQTLLSAQVVSLEHWMKDKKMDAEVLGSQPEIRANIISLINIAQKEDVSESVLKQSEELIWLREHLGNACQKYGFVGFVIQDSTGYQVGAFLENAVGRRKLIERSDFFYRSLQGDTVVSHPFPGEIDLPDNQGNWKPNRPTMFVSTPIRNDTGEVLGVLAFRFRPEMEFTHILEVTRFGRTGESYAFNDEGVLLTESRFIGQLKKQGLLAESDPTSILKIQLRDPRKILTSKANFRRKKNNDSPLTRMAASAIQDESGVNLEGYNDYRGIRVVGAWTWLSDHYMGIATEIDAQEAFGPLYTISRGFLAVFGLLTVATLVVFLIRLLQMRTETERNLAQEHVREGEKAIKSLAKFTSENPSPILRIGKDGKLLYANRPAFALLNDQGIQAGDQVNTEFQAMVANALASKSIQEIETRIGTQTFLLQWVPVLNEGYINIYGRDITESKKAETKLKNQAKQQAALTKLGSIALAQSNLSELMDHAVHLFGQTLQVDYSKILIYIPEEQTFLLQAGKGWKEGLVGKVRVSAGINSQAGYTLQSKNPVVVRDLNRETRFTGPELLHEHGVVSGMSVIIPSGNRPFGVIGVHTKKIRIFTPDEINFLQSMANILANAIERKKAEEKLWHSNEELKRSNQELEDFAFIASHDLQEPLRKVMLFGDRIKSVYPSDGDDRGVNYIDRLQKSISKMQNFINDLLGYSKVTQSSSPLGLLNLNEIIVEVVSDLQTQFDRAQGKITIEPLPAIEGDEFLMAQLFQNLISNALKYSRENVPPKIKIRTRQNGDTAWDILVEDNGIGVDPKYFHKIFKPFERLHSSDRYGGNGIGLAICSKVCSRHRGKIRIESQPGKGSTFILTLPKVQPADSGAIKETEFVAG